MSDPFVKLPVELIDEIVELVHEEHPKQYLGAVSKAFLPSSRRLFFTQVTGSSARLSKLSNIVAGAAAVGDAVQMLDIRGDKFGSLIRWISPTSNVLQDLLGRLPFVTEVVASSHRRLADAILQPTRGIEPFPRLKSLTLKEFTGSDVNPFQPSNFASLHKYPSLNALTIKDKHFKYRVDPDEDYVPENEEDKQRNVQLSSQHSWYLSLFGSLSDNPVVSELLGIFSAIDTLKIEDTGWWKRGRGPALRTFLMSLQRPAALTALSCYSDAFRSEGVISAFPFVPNLESLELGERSFSPAVLPHLSTLPSLRRLVITRGSNISSEELKPVLGLPSLRTLRLDLVYKPTRKFFLPSPFAYPGWSSSFTLKGCGELLDLAESKNVNLVGLAVGLVKREREYEKRWGKKQG